MTRIRHLILVPASLKAAANRAAHRFDAVNGDKTFTIPLYDVGDKDQLAPSLHWTSVSVRDADDAGVKSDFQAILNAKDFTYDIRKQPSFPQDKLRELGIVTKKVDFPR